MFPVPSSRKESFRYNETEHPVYHFLYSVQTMKARQTAPPKNKGHNTLHPFGFDEIQK
jgi:hypothetical protein